MCRGRARPAFTQLSYPRRAERQTASKRATMQVMLSRPPAALASSTSRLHAASGSLSSARTAAMRSSVQHVRQAVGAEQEHVARLQVGLPHIDLHAGLAAAQDVGDDVPPLVAADLLRLDDAAAGHFRRQCCDRRSAGRAGPRRNR